MMDEKIKKSPEYLMHNNNMQTLVASKSLVPFEITGKSAEGLPKMSGYVSTSSPDFGNEILTPSAFVKYFPYYKRNPIYCFNHEKALPIGRVANPYLNKKGLYLEDIQLTPTKLVTDYLAPLITDKVLTQQSVGYKLLKSHVEGDFLVLDEIFLLESSLVSVAMNPEAVLDQVKHLVGLS